jgi:hypothetical protein
MAKLAPRSRKAGRRGSTVGAIGVAASGVSKIGSMAGSSMLVGLPVAAALPLRRTAVMPR